ncbi:hypothetical protein [Neisseria sicca]|uniref:hypothetical protein n=1 Tax=Neisseria sicca TaxID=490 RepID=UPI003606CFB9
MLAQGEQAAVVGFVRAAVLLVPNGILRALGGGAVFSGVLRGGAGCQQQAGGDDGGGLFMETP